MTLNEKAREIRFQHLLSNKEMADLTANCRFGKISEATVRKWFSFSNPSSPRECYLETIEKELKNYSPKKMFARRSTVVWKLQFTMKEFSIKRNDVSEILSVKIFEVDRWLKHDDPEKPTEAQINTLRKEALCLAKKRSR